MRTRLCSSALLCTSGYTMKSKISMNGVPMIWITVDENPRTGEFEAFPSRNFKDYLIPADEFDGSIPDDYWDKD